MEALSTRKLANGGLTSGIVAAHRPCEPLLFFFSRGDASSSMGTRHRNMLEALAEAIEPALGGERCDRTAANGSVISPSELGAQRRNVRYGERLSIPKNFRGEPAHWRPYMEPNDAHLVRAGIFIPLCFIVFRLVSASC